MKINRLKKWSMSLVFGLVLMANAVRPTEAQAGGYPPWDIVERLVYANQTYCRGHFDAVIAALVKTGLVEAVAEGRVTVFAPTDAAFAEIGLNARIINELDPEINEAEIANLRNVLLYHVTEGRVSYHELKRRPQLLMLNLDFTRIRYFRQWLVIVAANSDAKIFYGLPASNGNLYFIDDVLLPPDGDGDGDGVDEEL